MELNVNEKVDQMKAEILALMGAGVIPRSVQSFAELHDFVDANCIGGFCDDDYFHELYAKFGGPDGLGGMPNGMVDFINACQNGIDAWLKARKAEPTEPAVPAPSLEDQVQQLVELAMNGAVGSIQSALGVTDGGFAALYFSDGEVQERLEKYILQELYIKKP